MIEHFSKYTLSIGHVPEDELGIGYEYLIKKFADDSGHTAAEFYTNRTVVRLMTELLEPQEGESIYDPTCGSGWNAAFLCRSFEGSGQGISHIEIIWAGTQSNHFIHCPNESISTWL